MDGEAAPVEQADKAAPEAVPGKVAAVAWAVPGDGAAVLLRPVHGFCGTCHRVAGYNGYTCCHLPVWSGKPDLPSKEDAIFAILAARMALSSLEIRSWLK